jgi:transcriptional regulator with XRE-family HTH domain
VTPDERRVRRQVGKRVRVQRVAQELTQEELAQRAGVTRNFVSAIERSAQGLDAYRLGLVAEALGMDLHGLLTELELRVTVGSLE